MIYNTYTRARVCVKQLKCALCKIRAHLQFSMHIFIHVYKSTLILTNYKTSSENIYFKGKHKLRNLDSERQTLPFTNATLNVKAGLFTLHVLMLYVVCTSAIRFCAREEYEINSFYLNIYQVRLVTIKQQLRSELYHACNVHFAWIITNNCPTFIGVIKILYNLKSFLSCVEEMC